MTLLPHQQSERSVELVHTTFRDLLKGQTARDPSREFLIFPESDRTYTYGEFYDLTIAAAHWLRTTAPHRGAVSIIFRNTPEFLAIFFGAVALGKTVIPINPDLAAPEIRFIITNGDSNCVFYDPDLKKKLAPLESEIGSDVKFIPFGDVAELPQVDIAAVEANLPYVDPTTPAAIIYTSGTTGYPKGVVLSHMNFLVDGKGMADWFEFSPGTRSLCILPLFHNNGLVVSLTTTLHAGGSIVMIDPKASLRSFWTLVEKYNATFTSVMPSILAAILALGFEGCQAISRASSAGASYCP